MLRQKLPLIYRYLERALIDKVKHRTLYAQLHSYLVSVTTLDLCDPAVVNDHIFISTVHKAKGLEFDRVIIPDAADGVYPFFMSWDDDEKREDARKLYVALSRAKERISVCYRLNRSNQYGRCFPQTMSPFIRDVSDYFEQKSCD